MSVRVAQRPGPCSKLVMGYRASQIGTPLFKNPFPILNGQGKPNEDRAKWDLGWHIRFYGEELPGG